MENQEPQKKRKIPILNIIFLVIVVGVSAVYVGYYFFQPKAPKNSVESAKNLPAPISATVNKSPAVISKAPPPIKPPLPLIPQSSTTQENLALARDGSTSLQQSNLTPQEEAGKNSNSNNSAASSAPENNINNNTQTNMKTSDKNTPADNTKKTAGTSAQKTPSAAASKAAASNPSGITVSWYSAPQQIKINFLAKMLINSAVQPYLTGHEDINVNDFLDNTVIYDAGKVQGGDYDGKEIYKLDYTDPATNQHTKIVALALSAESYLVLEKNSDPLPIQIPSNSYVSMNKDLVITNMK